MKDHFLGLFKYNDWANQKLLLCLQKNKVNEEQILTLYNHLIIAQNVWLNRINNISSRNLVLWETKKLLDLIELTHKSSEDWIKFLQEYNLTSFEEVIAYQNTKGQSYETGLTDIVIHVINHSTHHRAQIVHLLRSLDVEPPRIDYIFFCRENV
ncbi:MAG: hypothetical protein MI921_16020 [Cytophagales bacterium]|nr:hypothetical protein [Cytophagales bacterium]